MLVRVISELISKVSGRFPLRVVIMIPFVVLVILAGGATGYLSLRNGQEAVNNVASQLRSEITARIQERVKSFLETAHLVNELHGNDIELNLIKLEPSDLQNTKELEHYFWKQIQSFTQITNTFIGMPDGHFYGARGVSRDNNVPDGSKATPQIIVSELDASTNKASLNYYNTDKRGDRTNFVEGASGYDPRDRSWYADAVKAGQPIWSEIYPEFTTQALAITAARPVYDEGGNLKGVLGSTAIFSLINKFLNSLQIGKTGQTFIMERTGNLVATSTLDPVFTTGVDGKSTKRIKGSQSQNELIRETAKFLEQGTGGFENVKGSQQLNFDIHGKRQFIQVTPLNDGRGLDWLVVVTIPEADFMEQIDKNTYWTVVMSMIALLFTVFIGYFTSRWILNPILELKDATGQFAAGDWDQKLPVERSDELGDLAKSFNSMGEQVKQAFHELEEINATLEKRVAERTQELKKAYEELKASQAQLVQSEKMASLGQMVAGVAHEINTPLGYVRSNVEMTRDLYGETEKLVKVYDKLVNLLISEDVSEEELNNQLSVVAELSTSFEEDNTFEETQALFKDILYGLDQISELVVNLKDFSRLDQAKVSDVNLNDCLNSVLVIGHNILKQKAVVDKQYGDVPMVQCSPSQINQVFLNILTNAAQAIEDRGKIIIRTRHDDKNVYVEIQDNGAGIPEDVVPKIFDPFFTTKPVGEGTGMGLAICYQIVKQHQGQIDVESKIGKGTKFTITLPQQLVVGASSTPSVVQ